MEKAHRLKPLSHPPCRSVCSRLTARSSCLRGVLHLSHLVVRIVTLQLCLLTARKKRRDAVAATKAESTLSDKAGVTAA